MGLRFYKLLEKVASGVMRIAYALERIDRRQGFELGIKYGESESESEREQRELSESQARATI